MISTIRPPLNSDLAISMEIYITIFVPFEKYQYALTYYQQLSKK